VRAGMRLPAVFAGLLLLAASALPAYAANQTVGIGGNAYAPPSVNVDPGDTVTWRWNGPDTNHSVTARSDQAERFDSDPEGGDGGYYGPSFPNLIVHFPGDTFSHRFTTPGTYTYFCRVHGFMRGTVSVTGEAPPASSPPSGGGAPPASGSQPPGQGASPPPDSSGGATEAPSRPAPAKDMDAPRIGSVAMKPPSFCAKRSRSCRRPGARLRFNLSEDADVIGRIAAIRAKAGPGRLTGSMTFRGKRGANSVTFKSARLRPGSYRLTLTATDAAGNRSEPARVSFRIRKP
jgi:plastocyanin